MDSTDDSLAGCEPEPERWETRVHQATEALTQALAAVPEHVAHYAIEGIRGSLWTLERAMRERLKYEPGHNHGPWCETCHGACVRPLPTRGDDGLIDRERKGRAERYLASAGRKSSEATMDASEERMRALPTVPEAGGYRTEYLHDRYSWVPCDVVAETAPGRFTVDTGRAQPYMGTYYDVPASQIRRV